MKAKMFSKKDIEDATIDPEHIGEPGIFDVGPIHWLAHKFGWNKSKPVLCWAYEHTFIGFKCEDCQYLSPRNYTQQVYYQQRRTDWPDGLWPKAVQPEYLKELEKIPYYERMKMIMGDPSVDLPEYCVCRVPERPLIDGVWCRECQGKVEEVTVKDLSNYAHGYVEETPFEGRVIGRSDNGDPVMTWIQSVKTGKQYELYEWQFEAGWKTMVILNSPYGAYNHGESGTKIPNGTPGHVEGKINPTKGNQVIFKDYEHLDNVEIPSHWLKIVELE